MSHRNDLESDDDRPSGPPDMLDDQYHNDNQDEHERPAELPPRRQHKYTTADLQPERPWKRYFLTCLACLVIIVIMVLLSLFLQRLFDPPEDEDWNDDNNNANNNTITDDDQAGAVSGIASLLPKNSDFLDDVCAEAKLSTPEGKQACEDACAPAVDCCDPYSNNRKVLALKNKWQDVSLIRSVMPWKGRTIPRTMIWIESVPWRPLNAIDKSVNLPVQHCRVVIRMWILVCPSTCKPVWIMLLVKT